MYPLIGTIVSNCAITRSQLSKFVGVAVRHFANLRLMTDGEYFSSIRTYVRDFCAVILAINELN